ncbi:3-deoxy-manno-octulosonate cytidylyltransferase [Phytohalomonas tamaricis]|uniref:3-deoxy-manno-octulosonate cytidylyltransferase n=1 Tax=Phytohalomonas tamaricis TaxID=2081032 RepID=UPI000D0B519A|nr:3-deoxy-manno-octulosonate cytidylyltransferase [Phytohalomonas tamaricis]
MTDEFIVVIPARYASSRLPGKPLADIAGRSMIEHVWMRATESNASRVIIATDSEQIERVACGFGAEVMLTKSDHPNGTARLAEVAARLQLPADAQVVNVQGDEPLLPPALINLVASRLSADKQASIATLAETIDDFDTMMRSSVVKVVRDVGGRALYFSRAPIPWDRDRFATGRPTAGLGEGWLRHIGIYAYRAGFLAEYVKWTSAPIEEIEQLEQLRAMYYGHRIQVAITPLDYPAGVDTPEDLERIRILMQDKQ